MSASLLLFNRTAETTISAPGGVVTGSGSIAGVSSITNGTNYLTGDVNLVAQVVAPSTEGSAAFTMNPGSSTATLSVSFPSATAGLSSLAPVGVTDPLTGAASMTPGAGISFSGDGGAAGTFDIANSGVLSLTKTGVTPVIKGAVSLTQGAGVSLTQAGQAITVANSGVTGITGTSGAKITGDIAITGAGLTASTNGSTLALTNTGVLSVKAGAGAPVSGAVLLTAGTNVSFSTAGQAITINSTGGGGGGVSSVATSGTGSVAAVSGAMTLKAGTGVTFTGSTGGVDGTIQVNSTGSGIATLAGASGTATGTSVAVTSVYNATTNVGGDGSVFSSAAGAVLNLGGAVLASGTGTWGNVAGGSSTADYATPATGAGSLSASAKQYLVANGGECSVVCSWIKIAGNPVGALYGVALANGATQVQVAAGSAQSAGAKYAWAILKPFNLV